MIKTRENLVAVHTHTHTHTSRLLTNNNINKIKEKIVIRT